MCSSPEQISHSPRVYLADGFASDGDIAHVLHRYGAAPDDLGVAWGHGIAGTWGELPIDADPVLTRLADRIEAALGFGSPVADRSFRFRSYALGDHHPAHVDCYAIDGHHLMATALVYLTDARQGGETVFPDAQGGPLAISARAGRLAMWFNYTPDGEIDARSRHQSEALRAGEKSTLAYFVYAPIACAAIQPLTRRLPEPA